MTTTIAMPRSQGQPSARKRSGGVFVTMVTTQPMNQGTALSLSATNNSTTNKAANSHFALAGKVPQEGHEPGRRLRVFRRRRRRQQSFEKSEHFRMVTGDL